MCIREKLRKYRGQNSQTTNNQSKCKLYWFVFMFLCLKPDKENFTVHLLLVYSKTDFNGANKKNLRI